MSRRDRRRGREEIPTTKEKIWDIDQFIIMEGELLW
jgi:hypothetical protein